MASKLNDRITGNMDKDKKFLKKKAKSLTGRVSLDFRKKMGRMNKKQGK